MRWVPFLILIATWLSVSFASSSSGSPPSLVLEPVDTVAGYDGPDGLILSATLQCKGRHDDSVITWYKDDQPVENAGIPSVNVSHDGWLTVGTTDSSDDVDILEGYYFCTVMNNFGNVRSRTAWIKGQQLKTSAFLWASGSLFLNENAVAIQALYVDLPLPDSLVLWSVACETSTVTCLSVNCPFWHHFSTSGRLLVYSVISMRYSEVQAVISECSKTSSITVVPFGEGRLSGLNHVFNFNGNEFQPRGARMPTVSVKVGGTAILYCISDDPNSTYSWNHNGSCVDVNLDNRYSLIAYGTLEIKGVVETDSGQYECIYTFPSISSSMVTREASVNLTVYSLPNVSLTLMESDMRGGNVTSCKAGTPSTTDCSLMHSHSPVTLHCTAGGSTPLVLKLVNNGVQLRHENGSVSLIHTVENASSGIYQCIATNNYGSQQTSMFLSVPGSTPTGTGKIPSSTPSPTTSGNGKIPSSTPSPTTSSRSTNSGHGTAPRQGSGQGSVSPSSPSGTGNQSPDKADSEDLPIAVIAGAAGGGIVLLLLLILLICCFRQRKKSTAYVSDSTRDRPSPNGTNLYADTSFTVSAGGQTQSNPYYATGENENLTSYETVPQPAATIHPVRRQVGLEAENRQAESDCSQYNVLDRNTPESGEIPVTAGAGTAAGYNTLGQDTSSKQPDNKEVEKQPTENEYTYAAPHFKQPHVTLANSTLPSSDEYVEPADQLHPPHSLSNTMKSSTNQPGSCEDDVYTEPADAMPRKSKKGGTKGRRVQPSNDTYTYANPNTKRSPNVEPDHVAVGETADEYAVSWKKPPKQAGKASTLNSPAENPYAVSSHKQTGKKSPLVSDENVYATPDTQTSSAEPTDHIAVGSDEYAITAKPAAKVGKQGQNVSDSRECLLGPEHFETGDDEYAVSTKPAARRMIGKSEKHAPSDQPGIRIGLSKQDAMAEISDQGPVDEESVEYATVPDTQ